MKKARILVLGLAGVVALALASPAFAVRTFTVSPQSYAVSGSGDFTIEFAQEDSDPPLAKVTIYAPPGYSSLFGQTVGTQIGTLKALVLIKSLAGAKAPVEGTVVVDDPAKYTTNPSSVACAGAVTHEAVWLLKLVLAGTALEVPMYVDRVTQGAEATFAGLKMQVCFASPDIPPAQGGQAQGATPLSAAITLKNVITNASTPGTYTWRALLTAYNPGTGVPNSAGTREARSLVALPTELTLTGKRVKKKVGKTSATFARLSGTLKRVGVGAPGLNVRILAGGKVVAVVKTRAGGVYSVDIRVRRLTSFTASAVIPVQRIDAQGCAGTSVAPAGCETATSAPATIQGRGTARLRP